MRDERLGSRLNRAMNLAFYEMTQSDRSIDVGASTGARGGRRYFSRRGGSELRAAVGATLEEAATVRADAATRAPAAGRGARSESGAARPRIRFIHNYFYPDLSSVSQVITDIARYLADQGCAVSVVASKNLYGGGGSSGLATRERLGKVRVRRVWAPSFGRLSLLGRMLDQLAFMAGATRSALFAPRADTVVLLTNPPLFAALGLLLKALRRERFVYVVMDLYPDVAIRSGHLRAHSPLARMLRWMTRATLRSAHRVVVLGECMKERVLAYGVAPGKVEVIRNWASDEVVEPVGHAENAFRTAMGWDGKFVVMYSGNMGVAHAFDDILEVARRNRDRDDIVFAFIGDGVRRAEIEQLRAREGLSNVVLLPYQEQSTLSFSLGAADAHLITLRSGFEGLVVPSKVYGAMAAARPILYVGDRSGDVARMVEEQDIGFVIPQGGVDELESAILRLAEDRGAGERLGLRAREALVRRYSRKEALAHYRRVLLASESKLRLAAEGSP